MFDTIMLTDVLWKHRCNHVRGEAAAHPDHGPLSPYSPSRVELHARIKDGSLWMSSPIKS